LGLFLSACIDLYTTFRHLNFTQLESNPIYLLTNSPLLLVLVKFGVIGFLYYVWVKSENGKPTTQFFQTAIIIILIFTQVLVGFNNIKATERSKDFIEQQTGVEYESPAEVPSEVIKEFLPSKEAATKAYFNYIWQMMVLPLLICMVTFGVWKGYFSATPTNKKGDKN
jgi:high-affinity K+ transport system ATPase subunit B